MHLYAIYVWCLGNRPKTPHIDCACCTTSYRLVQCPSMCICISKHKTIGSYVCMVQGYRIQTCLCLHHILHLLPLCHHMYALWTCFLHHMLHCSLTTHPNQTIVHQLYEIKALTCKTFFIKSYSSFSIHKHLHIKGYS